jgi:RNA polymerase-binding transcription factor DksA
VDDEQARERLEAEQARVAALVNELRGELGSEGTAGADAAEHDHHPDTAAETFEREKDLSILEQLEFELAELQAALERIDNGTYGIDEVTGEAIDLGRLEVLPAARTNVTEERR